MDDGTYNIFACGMGGQGVVLMSNIIGEACAIAGRRVVSGEMHGLSQRSGSVFIHQRIGENALSPLIPHGEGDVILALEVMEALRYLAFLKPGGTVLTSTRLVQPPGESQLVVSKKGHGYVEYEKITEAIRAAGVRLVEIDALDLAKEAGNPMSENVAMVGALSILPGFPLEKEHIIAAVEATVPKRALAINVAAFEKGRQRCAELLASKG